MESFVSPGGETELLDKLRGSLTELAQTSHWVLWELPELHNVLVTRSTWEMVNSVEQFWLSSKIELEDLDVAEIPLQLFIDIYEFSEHAASLAILIEFEFNRRLDWLG